MEKQPKENTTDQISFDSFKIQICKDPALQPFLNVFHFQGENVDQEKIGELFGIIQIQDRSEKSKYLPNAISQVIKKEFFRLPRRTSQESLESALHKANSALGDLARQENVNWIGKLDAVIGSFKEDVFSFSQTGDAKIFFIRNKKITEITKDLSEQSDNPIKTFSNVSSGAIEIGDKILFSTQSINDSLPPQDLSRHINTFSSDEFDNLLHSTLEYEGSNVGTIMVNVKKKETVKTIKQKKQGSNRNYFGSDKDSDEEKKEAPQEKESPANSSSDQLSSELNDPPLFEEKKENKKTEKELLTETTPQKETANAKTDIADGSLEENKQDQENIAKEASLSPFEEQPELFINEDETGEINEEIEEKTSLIKKASEFFDLFFSKESLGKNASKLRKFSQNTQQKGIEILNRFSNQKNIKSGENETKKKESKETNAFSTGDLHSEEDEVNQKLKNFWRENEDKKNSSDFFNSFKASFLTISGKIGQKNQTNFQGKTKKTLLLIFGIGIFLIFSFLIFKMIISKNKTSSNTEEQSTSENIQDSKDIELLKKETGNFEKKADFEKETIQLATDNGKLYALTKEGSFYEYDLHSGSTREIQIKDENPKQYKNMVAMDDLNFIFFLSQEKIMSYNRVTENFEQHSISLPENLELIDVGVKGTYLYLADKNSGQIYRYPRSEKEGFGAPKLWLTNETDLSKATDIAIDDSIYVSYSDGKIEKYFKYKLEKTFLLEAEQKIDTDKIATTEDFPFYYALDQEQGIVAKINKETNKVEEKYQSASLQGASDIYLEPKEKNVFVLAKNSLLRLK